MSLKIAVIAKEGIRLNAFLQALEQSVLVNAEICLLTIDPEDQSAVCGTRTLAFSLLEDFDFSDLSLCIVLESKLVVDAYQAQLQALDCPVLGFLGDLQALDPKVYTPESKSGVLGFYQPAALALQQVFAGFELDCLDAVVLYPVSVYGQPAVEELAAQAAKLLSGQTVETNFFHTQMAFNYFPMQATASGRVIAETLTAQLRDAFDGVDVSARAVQMPVFHGLSISLSVEVAERVSKEQFFEQLALVDAVEPVTDIPSNYEIAQRGDAILVSNWQQDAVNDHRFECMIGFDDVKFAFGKNMIHAAEKLLKSYL